MHYSMTPPLNVSILSTYIMNNRCEHLAISSQITLPTYCCDYSIAGQWSEVILQQ